MLVKSGKKTSLTKFDNSVFINVVILSGNKQWNIICCTKLKKEKYV